MANSRNLVNNTSNKFLDVLTKYGIVILIAIYLIPYIIKYYKDSIDKGKVEDIANETAINNAQNETYDPEIQHDKATKYLRDVKHYATKNRIMLQDATQKLAMLFHTDKAWYNPQSWYYDQKAISNLLKLHALNYDDIKWLYYNVYTKSRNLTNDIINEVKSPYIDELRTYYNKWKLKKF